MGVCDLTPPMLAIAPAWAQSVTIEQAKANGLVGELPNGLLGPVKPSPAVETLINNINTLRLEKYRAIAAQ
jgi:uncharacterized protein YdbL (DUF1318 family)